MGDTGRPCRIIAGQWNWIRAAQDHLNLGMALIAQGSVAEGIEEYKTGLKMDPNDVAGHHELAKIYHSLGRLRDAAEEWTEVLRRDPGHVAAAKGLGMVLVKAGHGADAIRFLQAALAAEPRDLETRKYKALAHLAARQTPAAIGEFREILRRDPENQHALNSVAWIEATSPDAALRNGEEAVDFARKVAGRQKRDVPQLLDTLAAAYAEAGRFKEAAETARKAKKAAEQGKDAALATEIDARLKLYEAGKPYREAMP